MATTAVEEALLEYLQELSISNSDERASPAKFDHSIVKSLHGFGYVEAEDIPEASIIELKKRKLLEARNDTWFSLKN